MGALKNYLQALATIHAVGEAVEETSYYGRLETLVNEVGDRLSPTVMCILTTKNRGAGVPDGGLFLRRQAVVEAGENAMLARAPERGAMEVKGPGENVRSVARSKQVRRYLERYGQVLVTTYREFLPLRVGRGGEVLAGEPYSLADSEEAFWAVAGNAKNLTTGQESEFEEYLRRVLLADAPLSSPEDLAWFLAHYARTGLERLEAGGELEKLAVLRTALEDALGLRFEGVEGDRFFRSALVQTLFYGVFAAWVVWSGQHPPGGVERFSWRQAQWTLNVPMVRVLFQQLATPANLPVGLDEVLDWTDEVLNRVDRELFFKRFETEQAVPYFYEPFLQEYDPELRRQLGVWYTPPEVVRYMVARVHEALQRDLGLPLGLADEQVHVLDPCAGTGSFLTEAMRTIARVLEEQHGDALVGEQVKQSALTRIHGFELLPAPFVVAHLQLGLLLHHLGGPLDADAEERAGVYLTNALTGWADEDHPRLPFPEFEQERDAAESVKREEPILVVLGNPPYNAYAGVSPEEEGGLVDPYRQGLTERWDITKNKLDDLYIRFLRLAERRITEVTGKGIVCFISNFGWLGDPSTVVMRQRIVREFDRIAIDNLNGDSRETGKKTPEGAPDPSVFSTRLNPPGIQVGTAVSLLVRRTHHDDGSVRVYYRDFWGANKRQALEASLSDAAEPPAYDELEPSEENWYRLRRWAPREGYAQWPSVIELAAEEPLLGLNENRDGALFAHDRDVIVDRMQRYLDPDVDFHQLGAAVEPLTQNWSDFDPKGVRDRLLKGSPFDEKKVVRLQVTPFDMRWGYVDTTAKLWNRSRPELVAAAAAGSDFLLVRRRAPRALDGAAFLISRCLIDQHVMHKDAYTIPFWVAAGGAEAAESLFEEDGTTGLPWRPNLSEFALRYLEDLGITDADTSQASARLLWLHVLATGYSPLYLEENGDAIRNDWPRVPLPGTRTALEESAAFGDRLAALLDIDTPLTGVDINAPPHLRAVAVLERARGVPAASNPDLALRVGWGIQQVRVNQRTGTVTHVFMPGAGRVESRPRTDRELDGLSNDAIQLLGSEVLDVYLNENFCWRGIPQAVWDYKIGGFQVLRKWLSYREERILGRALRIAEARVFTSICRRLTELVLLGPHLDGSYLATTGAAQQDPLWALAEV